MANEKRETKRERRDEAKRRRLEELKRRQRRERMQKLMFGGVVVVIVVGIILLVTLLGGSGGNSAELNRLASAAGCSPIQKHSNEGATHVSPPQSVTYRANPPTSGNHYGTWAGTGVHVAAIQNEIQVHNLEHGHVLIQYQESLDRAILDVLYAAVKADSEWLVIAPNPNIPGPLTFSAWEHSQVCNSPTTAQAVGAAFRGFVEAHKDNGPESIAGTPQAGTDTATPPTSAGSPTASPSPTASST